MAPLPTKRAREDGDGDNNASASYVRPKILLLGDSLTQRSFAGWGAKLAHVYQRRADVINRGYSGYNTEYCLRLPMEDFRGVRLVIIFFGANDAALKDRDPHHHVPVDEYASNLKTLIGRVREKYQCGDNNILLLTPPPVHHEQRLAYQKKRYKEKATGELERTLETTGKYAEACERVASECNLPCVNLYRDMLKTEDWGSFFYDGLHFSPAGEDYTGEAVLKAITDKFPSLAVTADPETGEWANSSSRCSGLTAGGPYHDQIDREDPGKAFETLT